MKKLTLSVVLVAICISCTQEKQFIIQGSTTVVPDGEFIFMEGEHYKDSVRVENGTFHFSGEPQQELRLLSSATRQFCFLIPEKGTIKVSLDLKSRVKGTPLNNEYQRFNDKWEAAVELIKDHPTDTLLVMEQRNNLSLFVKDYVLDNYNNEFGKLVLEQNIMIFPDNVYDELQSRLRLLPDKDEEFYTRILEEGDLNRKKSKTNKELVGTSLKSIHLLTINGETFPLTGMVGKSDYLFIEIWASWCGNCLASIPELKKVYGRYKDKGLEMVSISIDREKKDWIAAMKKHPTEWLQLQDSGKKGESVYDTFHNVFASEGILVDRNGIILQTGMKAKDLEYFLGSVY